MADGSVTQDLVLVAEKGRSRTGETLYSTRRLFVQLLAYGGCRDTAAVASAIAEAGISAVLYEDVNDPQGIAVVSYSENADFFLDQVRPFVSTGPVARLAPKPEYTMFGRTYAMGWESNMDEALIDRPVQRLSDPALRWAVWYPLRRAGSFEHLDEKEQHAVLSEHGAIGQSYGKAGIAHDIRLACHGMNKEDNDFVIGVLSAEMPAPSVIIQRMRKTRQTSMYLERLGPFFIGRRAVS